MGGSTTGVGKPLRAESRALVAFCLWGREGIRDLKVR